MGESSGSSQLILEQWELDRIHHALGSPAGPWVQPYRNYYVPALDDPRLPAMRSSGAWLEAHVWPQLTDGCPCFHVSPVGIRAHSVWLRERTRHMKAWECSLPGWEGYPSIVHAITRSRARYLAFLNGRESCPDLRIIDVRVRRAW